MTGWNHDKDKAYESGRGKAKGQGQVDPRMDDCVAKIEERSNMVSTRGLL